MHDPDNEQHVKTSKTRRKRDVEGENRAELDAWIRQFETNLREAALGFWYEVQKGIIDANSELEIAKAELNKLKAEQESELQGLEADLKIAKIDYEISQINLGKATFESEIDKKKILLSEPIKKLGIYTIPIKLHQEVTANLKVWVVKD